MNFEHKLDSKYWQANEVFWKTIVFPEKNLILLCVKDEDRVVLSNKEEILGRYSGLLNLVTITPAYTQKVCMFEGGKNHCNRTPPSCQKIEAEAWEGCRLQ